LHAPGACDSIGSNFGKDGALSTLHVQRILCDNPDCVMYVDELVREEPADGFELVEHVRTVAAVEVGWTRIGDSDFCPAHGGDAG
jgi:hypothetical protein